jgi:hypothetical protein
MSEQDDNYINCLAFKLVLTHSKTDAEILKNARRAITILHSNDKSLADGHDYHLPGLQEIRNQVGARRPSQREV